MVAAPLKSLLVLEHSLSDDQPQPPLPGRCTGFLIIGSGLVYLGVHRFEDSVAAFRIDGTDAHCSHAVIDWTTAGTGAAQHSFNCIASVTQGPGTHTFELIAYNHPSSPGQFVVGASSSLAFVLRARDCAFSKDFRDSRASASTRSLVRPDALLFWMRSSIERMRT